ncbi:hypothetical protein AX16_008439, partial [Volvariella volvacea WC 439]
IGELVTILYDLPDEFLEQSGAKCPGFQKGSVVRIGQHFPPQMVTNAFHPKKTAPFYTYQLVCEGVEKVERWCKCTLSSALEKNIARRLETSERSMKPGISIKRIHDGGMEYYVHAGCLEPITINRDAAQGGGSAAVSTYAKLKEALSAGKELNFLLPKNTKVLVDHKSYSVHSLGQPKTNGMHRRIEFGYIESEEEVREYSSIFTVPGFMLMRAGSNPQ